MTLSQGESLTVDKTTTELFDNSVSKLWITTCGQTTLDLRNALEKSHSSKIVSYRLDSI